MLKKNEIDYSQQKKANLITLNKMFLLKRPCFVPIRIEPLDHTHCQYQMKKNDFARESVLW